MKQPLDHLPPKEDRDEAVETDQPQYPDTGGPPDPSSALPDTEAEADKPNRHGVDRLPPSGR